MIGETRSARRRRGARHTTRRIRKRGRRTYLYRLSSPRTRRGQPAGARGVGDGGLAGCARRSTGNHAPRPASGTEQNTFRARVPRKTTVGPRRDARGSRKRRSRVRTIVRLGSDARVLGDRERATGFLHVRARLELEPLQRFFVSSKRTGMGKFTFRRKSFRPAYARAIDCLQLLLFLSPRGRLSLRRRLLRTRLVDRRWARATLDPGSARGRTHARIDRSTSCVCYGNGLPHSSTSRHELSAVYAFHPGLPSL